MTVQIMQTNLISEFDVTRNGRLPSLLFVDVQKSQIKDVVSTITDRIGEEPQSIPTVRGRIAFINGQPFDFQQREVRQQQGIIGREFALTYRPNLDENATRRGGQRFQAAAKLHRLARLAAPVPGARHLVAGCETARHVTDQASRRRSDIADPSRCGLKGIEHGVQQRGMKRVIPGEPAALYSC